MNETLTVEREIAAEPSSVFEAWTTPKLMEQWWGPEGCAGFGIEIDLQIGGRFRIGNRLPDDREIWIFGTFVEIQNPTRLVYTWGVEPEDDTERVTVSFDATKTGTRVVVLHERIASEQKRREHTHGWTGCLDGLTELLQKL